MALKALDQRLAVNASPGPSSAVPNGGPSTPRLPPAAVDAPAMPSPPPHAAKKSAGELDVGDMGKP